MRVDGVSMQGRGRSWRAKEFLRTTRLVAANTEMEIWIAGFDTDFGRNRVVSRTTVEIERRRVHRICM